MKASKRVFTAEELRAIKEKQIINVDELSALTGFGRQWIYNEVFKAKVLGQGIPFVKYSTRAVRFNLAAVLAWLETRNETFVPMVEVLEVNWMKKQKAPREPIQKT